MQYTMIPGTPMRVSRLCLGTMTFGTPVPAQEAVSLTRLALDAYGVNFIDTANMYEGYSRSAGSAGGVAEEIVGRAVKGRRGDFIIATKLGMKVGPAPEDDMTGPEAIRVQLRRSLHRLQTDYVDVYYLHRYDPDTPPHLIARAMGEEMKEGLIRAWAVSNYTAEQLKALLLAAKEENVAAPVLCQPQMSLLCQGPCLDMLPLCAENGLGVVPYQVLHGGYLTGKYAKETAAPSGSRMAEKPGWMKPMTDADWRIVENARAEALKAGVTMTQYALSWALRQQGVVSALIGVKREEQLREAAEALA
ncbi:MAG: aldo/keto reductase [Clostridia bacterium]|nr:aldo/keto reductase [Clostridia bacterium]